MKSCTSPPPPLLSVPPTDELRLVPHTKSLAVSSLSTLTKNDSASTTTGPPNPQVRSCRADRTSDEVIALTAAIKGRLVATLFSGRGSSTLFPIQFSVICRRHIVAVLALEPRKSVVQTMKNVLSSAMSSRLSSRVVSSRSACRIFLAPAFSRRMLNAPRILDRSRFDASVVLKHAFFTSSEPPLERTDISDVSGAPFADVSAETSLVRKPSSPTAFAQDLLISKSRSDAATALSCIVELVTSSSPGLATMEMTAPSKCGCAMMKSTFFFVAHDARSVVRA